MYTECPSCQTYFKITPNQLKAAAGKVRCGNCDEIFGALDSLVDVVPPEALGQFSSSLTEDSLIEDTAVSDIEASKTEALNANESDEPAVFSEPSDFESDNNDKILDSFADVDIPGITEAEEEDIELALASAMVEPKSDKSPESKPVDEQKEISDDIDAALDGLFDGNTEISPDATPSIPAKPDTPALSSISELDELQNIDFGNLGEEKTINRSTIPSIGNTLSALADSDKDSNFIGDTNIGLDSLSMPLGKLASEKLSTDDTSSLSQFEREFGKKSPKKSPAKKKVIIDESSFDLSESFLNSGMSDDGTGSTVKRAIDQGNNFILEEIDEIKGQSGSSGIVVKTAWIIVIISLLLVLVGQFAYFKRQDLALYPELRPVIESLCNKLNKIIACDIPASKNTSAIVLLDRNVVSHPNAKNALLITSTIKNKAKFDQPFPVLILTFSDINQKIIAKRKFNPPEYLSKNVDIKAGMEKDVPIKLMLEIVDPGGEAVNFEFNFQ